MTGDYPSTDFEISEDGGVRRVVHMYGPIRGRQRKFDQLMPTVAETEQIVDRRNSRARIFLTDRGYGISRCAEKVFASRSERYRAAEQSSASDFKAGAAPGCRRIAEAA